MAISKAWIDRYPPKTIEECFLPSATRAELQKYVADQNVPTMLFVGPPGIGKTSAAKALCSQLDLEEMLINASLVGIDAVRTQIIQFSSTVSFNGLRKVVILDEADGLTVAAQEALRGIINEFADNVSFIATANNRNKLSDPLLSRFSNEVNFLFPPKEMKDLAIGIYGFIETRLKEENVSYDPSAVKKFIVQNLQKSTDIRKLLIKAQKIADTGVFNEGSIINLDEARFEQLIPVIRSKDFTQIRTWVGENSDIDNSDIVHYVFNNASKFASGKQISMLILMLNEYQFKHAFVADKELNTAAMLSEISVSI